MKNRTYAYYNNVDFFLDEMNKFAVVLAAVLALAAADDIEGVKRDR